MTENAPLWLFADQLGPHVHGGEHAHREIVLVESEQVLRRSRWHRQKLHIVLSALRHAARDLGDRVTFLRTRTYREALERVGRPVVVHEPTSFDALHFVERLQAEGLVADVLPTPTFALPRREFEEWAGDRQRFLMEDFYRDQRRRFGVLMDGDEPVGGRWNLDAENRESPPRRRTLGVPPPYRPVEDEVDEEVRADLDAMDLDTVGADGPRLFAVTPGEAREALRHFVETRLATFGRYEDAMLAEDWAMSHSLLSVPFNLGVLHPLDAAHAAEQAYHDGAVPLAAAEGFIRQVIGWREYIWHLYWHFGPDYTKDNNALNAHTPLPDWFRDLDGDAVTARCLSDVLSGLRDRGWVHHIPRLMVLGNHALQRGYDPRELSDWYATSFVDGFAWVMPTNVVGMSQHADGGRLATKPYAAGGAYISRMSDYCGGCAYDPTVRVGETACPYTAGYWNFVHRHEERLARNPRTSRAVAGMHRLKDLHELVEQESARESY